MKMLITGAYGLLGTEISKLYPEALKPKHEELDITDSIQVDKYIEENSPDVVIHLAAAVSPPRCELNKSWAWRTNVDGTRYLVEACLKFTPDVYFIYMSTPCEFNGDSDRANYEYDDSNPDNYYGFTKAIGRMVVEYSVPKHLIIRGNFVGYKKWPYPKAFIDRKSNYLFAHQIAKGMKEAIDLEMKGVIHIVGEEEMTMFELAKLCPDSENIEPYLLEEYYKENPNSCRLTKNMILGVTRWKTYNIEEGLYEDRNNR